ncbi:hypothetical protein [Bradyrhizobium sp. RDM4]|uniref:hypothetical protein n=1 Tax=Bradyrhizobium sp. RDM4 TaxID=3378765 RepID=UPI0038FC4D3F
MTELTKAQWIDIARLSFRPGKRQPCHICGRFEYVTEAHHVVPIGQQFDRGFAEPHHEHVWLCPTHHAIVHVLVDGDPNPQLLGRRAAPVFTDHDEAAGRALLDLVKRSSGGGPQ